MGANGAGPCHCAPSPASPSSYDRIWLGEELHRFVIAALCTLHSLACRPRGTRQGGARVAGHQMGSGAGERARNGPDHRIGMQPVVRSVERRRNWQASPERPQQAVVGNILGYHHINRSCHRNARPRDPAKPPGLHPSPSPPCSPTATLKCPPDITSSTYYRSTPRETAAG